MKDGRGEEEEKDRRIWCSGETAGMADVLEKPTRGSLEARVLTGGRVSSGRGATLCRSSPV